MYVLGLDIGTTSHCAAVIDLESGAVPWTRSIPGPGFLASPRPYERIQDPASILENVRRLIDMAEREFPISAIGVTGQMHGILYLDKSGEPVSPLYTWQDGSGAQPFQEQETFAEFLTRHAALPVRPGYGASTYFCHFNQHRVPQEACCFSTIHDWIVMKLCSLPRPLTHPSDAASLGMFCLETGRFDQKSIEDCGMDFSFFPEIADEPVCGRFRGKIPVAAAIGDNQASFLGSVQSPEDSVLVNIGTGSQVSFWIPSPRPLSVGEIRPSADGGFLAVGSSLCGGRAYAILEGFFRQVLEMAGSGGERALYDSMEEAARKADAPFPQFSTLFCGTREDPSLRASIRNLSEENFTPGHLIRAAMEGIAGELFQFYRDMGPFPAKQIIGSGNGLRRNKLLREILQEMFRLPLKTAPYQEEAAIGAAIFASRTCLSLGPRDFTIPYHEEDVV